MGAKRRVDGATIYLAQAAILSFHSIVFKFLSEAVRVWRWSDNGQWQEARPSYLKKR